MIQSLKDSKNVIWILNQIRVIRNVEKQLGISNYLQVVNVNKFIPFN